MMLEKATEFYNLTDDQLQQYVDISHRPEASAIKHLIDEYTEGGDALGKNQYIVYECNLCDDGRKYYQLRDMERHCYNNGHNHRDANLKRIEDSAREDIADAKREMEKEIFLAAQAKNTATLRAAAESQRAAQAQAKKSLPYVK